MGQTITDSTHVIIAPTEAVVSSAGNIVDSTGNVINATNPLRVDPTGTTTQPVSGSLAIASITPATDRSGSGTITALNGAVAANTQGCSAIWFYVTGTWVATITPQGTVDGTNWFTIICSAEDQSISAAFTANQRCLINCGGLQQVRLTATAFTSGTVAISWDAGVGGPPIMQVWNTNATSLKTQARLQDSLGNNITTQANGAQRALDVGIDVAGVQVDPRSIRALTSSDVVSAAQSGTWNITNVSGTISLPTGASTSTNQTNGTQQTKVTDGTDIALVTAAGEQNVLATAQPGIDIGDVTINNASGASAVNIQDGGNSITVDGTVSTSPGGSTKVTYSAGVIGLVAAATATDIFTITGSGTKTVTVTRIAISGTKTADGHIACQILKRSTADTLGTSTTRTAVPHDSTDAAATATVLAYTANPTTGTLVGIVRSFDLALQILTPVGASIKTGEVINFGDSLGKGIVLRGTSQVLALNFNSVTAAGNLLNIYVEWTEE